MKLFIFLNEKIETKYLKEEDIVLTNNIIFFNKYKSKIKIVLTDFSLCDESVDVSKAINNFFHYLPSEFLFFRNTYFMRVFRPLHSIIAQIERLLKEENINEIILAGGSAFKFITLWGGEGEGSHKYFRSAWFFNPFLFEYFKGEIPIRWDNNSRVIFLKIFYFFREVFSLGKIVKQYSLALLKNKNSDSTANLKSRIIAFASLPLQINHFKKVLTERQLNNLTFVSPVKLVPDGVVFFPKAIDYISAIQLFIRVKKKLKSLAYIINGKKMVINESTFYRSVMLNFIQFNARLNCLKKIFPEDKFKNKYFITNMTFGEDIILINELAKFSGAKHYNFQAVTMSKMLFPKMDLADQYYLYSLPTYELYKEIAPNYHYYFPVKEMAKTCLKKNDKIVLSLFLQPDSYAERYFFFLHEIIPNLTQRKEIVLIVKPHYRQNKLKDFEKSIRNYSNIILENPLTSPGEIINKSDFILSMTSSVLFESIQLSCPGIIIDFDGLDKKFIKETCFPEINFVIKTKDDFIKIIEDPLKYKAIFFNRKSDFIARHSQTDLKDIFFAD